MRVSPRRHRCFQFNTCRSGCSADLDSHCLTNALYVLRSRALPQDHSRGLGMSDFRGRRNQPPVSPGCHRLWYVRIRRSRCPPSPMISLQSTLLLRRSSCVSLHAVTACPDSRLSVGTSAVFPLTFFCRKVSFDLFSRASPMAQKRRPGMSDSRVRRSCHDFLASLFSRSASHVISVGFRSLPLQHNASRRRKRRRSDLTSA